MRMKVEEISQSIRKEMNRRRRYGGAEDVPGFLWEMPAVEEVMQTAVQCGQQEEFNGDWEVASLVLEDSMTALASVLRKVSAAKLTFSPPDHGEGSHAWLSGGPHQRRSELAVAKTSNRFSALPALTRYDAGSRALADYMTWHWQNEGIVDYYRDQICGGQYLTRDQAWRFLTSPLPKVLTEQDYQSLGLCPVRTTGRLRSKFLRLDGPIFETHVWKIDPRTEAVTAKQDDISNPNRPYQIEVNLPSGKKRRHFLKRFDVIRSEKHFICVCHKYSIPRPYRVSDTKERERFAPLKPVPYFTESARYVEGFSSSIIGEMIARAELLCGKYQVTIWEMLEAMLTGQFLPLPAVELFAWPNELERFDTFDKSRGKITSSRCTAQGPATLTVQPWVTPEALADVWREFRKKASTYSPSEKQADALHFVLSHTESGAEFEWDKLAKSWEKELGELMTRGQLYKQFQRARAAVLPSYSKNKEGGESPRNQ